MTESKARPVSSAISPELEQIRDEQRERESAIVRRPATPASISPELVKVREATKAEEQRLSGRSLRQPPAR